MAPFLPVFLAGALTFVIGMFAGGYVYNRGVEAGGLHGYLMRGAALLIVGLCSFSFAFGFPWAAIF